MIKSQDECFLAYGFLVCGFPTENDLVRLVIPHALPSSPPRFLAEPSTDGDGAGACGVAGADRSSASSDEADAMELSGGIPPRGFEAWGISRVFDRSIDPRRSTESPVVVIIPLKSI
eukprot:969301-Amorphochlora_amoeboformis.AAC.1